MKSPLSTAKDESGKGKVRGTVLLVEDDDQLRDALEENLRSVGYAVISVPDGCRALQLARRGAKFDMLLTDLRMPGEIDGARLAAEIQVLRPEVAVIFSTGCAEEEMGSSEWVGGPKAILIKPYTRKQMEATLAAVAVRIQNRSSLAQ